MIREALRPWRHKLLVLASLLLVGFLTLIGIATQNTRERQGHVEKTFEVRNIHVDEALCAGHPHSTRCRHHALSLLKACLEYARCRHLVELTVEGKVPPGIRVRPPDEASDSNTSAPGTSNSSSENNETRGNPGTSAPGSSGAGHEPGAPNHTPPHAHPPSGGGHGQVTPWSNSLLSVRVSSPISRSSSSIGVSIERGRLHSGCVAVADIDGDDAESNGSTFAPPPSVSAWSPQLALTLTEGQRVAISHSATVAPRPQAVNAISR